MKTLQIFSRVCISLFFCFTFLLVHQACKKTDFISIENTKEDFFAPRKPVKKRAWELIQILKYQNEKHNFTDKIPQSAGLPIWDKMREVKRKSSYSSRDGFGEEGGEGFLVIPFAPSGSYLSGIVTAVPSEDSGYVITYYDQAFLNQVCHDHTADIEQVQNLFGLFMMMENLLFRRVDFYNVPDEIFPTNARTILTDSTKVSSITEGEEGISSTTINLPCYLVPSGVHHPLEEGPCDWQYNCSYCTALYCGNNPPVFPGGGPTSGGGEPECPFYFANPCEPENPPGNPDTLTPSQILQLLKEENEAILAKRDSVWTVALNTNEEYHFFVKKTGGLFQVLGITTDHDPDGVTPNRQIENSGNSDADYHTHQDPVANKRHIHDPQDVLNSSILRKKLYYRNYVDCGDTLYVIVNENLTKIKQYSSTHNMLLIQYSAEWKALGYAGLNRRSLGISLLLPLIGSSSESGFGVYKSINAAKTEFVKIN